MKKRENISRRSFLARTSSVLVSASCIGGTAGCGASETASQPAPIPAPAARKKTGRVVILGFDGVEPTIIDTMLAAGELPNLAKLREQGGYQRLASSNPPHSPTAWSSFATSLSPGAHGIFDFLRRDPQNYFPGLGFGSLNKPELDADGAVKKPAEFVSNRRGETFWAAANREGIRCKLLTVPYAYPAEDLKDSVMFCGLDIPDIRGTQSTFFALSDQYTQVESVAGGVKVPLAFQGDTAVAAIQGMRYPQKQGFAEVPMKVVADRQAHAVTIEIQGKTFKLPENTWSPWIEWTFEISPKFSVQAVSRVYAFEVGQQVRLYMTCLQVHPKAPYFRIATPPSYSAELAERYGLYETVGWTYDTKALEKDEMSEDVFLDDLGNTAAWREKLMTDELDRGNFELLIAGWTNTDRVAHMFWRFRDPKHPMYTPEGAAKYGRVIENAYIKMDATVGQAMARLTPDDSLMVLSDHGFHSSRTAFSVNTWLVRNGYLAVSGQSDPATAFNDSTFFVGDPFDWSKTKAYGLGLGCIYLNIEGREGSGIVAPADAAAVRAEIKQKLLAVTDPGTGDKVFSAVYTSDELYPAGASPDVPDLQLGYAPGYQTNKRSLAGAAPENIFEPNDSKWSGDHAASDVALTPGVFFSNRRLGEKPAIIDIAPTVLAHFGIPIPKSFQGKELAERS